MSGGSPSVRLRHRPVTATARGPEASEEKSKRNSHTSHGRGPAGAQEPSACRVEKTPTDPTGANRTREEQALTKMGHHGALGIEPYQPGTIIEATARCALKWDRSAAMRAKTGLQYTLSPRSDCEKTLTPPERSDGYLVKCSS
jgi:hypothetical protein